LWAAHGKPGRSYARRTREAKRAGRNGPREKIIIENGASWDGSEGKLGFGPSALEEKEKSFLFQKTFLSFQTILIQIQISTSNDFYHEK
jgi:hypothetical protein